jgi:hypothetical protein
MLACATVGVAGAIQTGSRERLKRATFQTSKERLQAAVWVVLFCAWTESIIVLTNGPNSIVVFKP